MGILVVMDHEGLDGCERSKGGESMCEMQIDIEEKPAIKVCSGKPSIKQVMVYNPQSRDAKEPVLLYRS